MTVPAYFDEARRTATFHAAEMAELNVLDIVNEPTAAALAFGERLGYLDETGRAKFDLLTLVYDLGGGTFDASIVHLRPQKIETLASDGDVRLSGADWDERLVQWMVNSFQENELADANSLTSSEHWALRDAACDLKHALTARTRAKAEFHLRGRARSVEITRDEFESLTRDLVARTAFTAREVLKSTHLNWRDVGRLLLVGGATRMPLIQDMLEAISGKSPDVTVNPDEAVARGAAIFAQHRLAQDGRRTFAPHLSIVDVSSHTLGIEGIDTATDRKVNTHIIPRNTALPVVVRRQFVTKSDNQPSVMIRVLEGEGLTADGCVSLGHVVIRNLPPGLPQGHPIQVEYAYNTNGRRAVRAPIDGQGTAATIELQRTEHLSGPRLAAWKQIVCRDGGWNDFETLLQACLLEEFHSTETNVADNGASDEARTAGLDSAQADEMDVDAPDPTSGMVDASDLTNPLPNPTPMSVRRRSLPKRMIWILAVGHLVASGVGLAIGYAILVWIAPEANFLNLPLPWADAAAVESIEFTPTTE